MNQGPMNFTSDVSLRKDDKTTMSGEQITSGQLIGLKMHRNSNYATRKVEVNCMGSTPRQVDRNPTASTH